MLSDSVLTPEERTELLADLERAYYTGALRIRFRERDVTYRSKAEMKEVIDDLRGLSATKKRPGVILTTFGRGR